MKSRHTAVIGAIILLFVLLAAGILWLSTTRVMPSVQTVTQPIPDDHIPH